MYIIIQRYLATFLLHPSLKPMETAPHGIKIQVTVNIFLLSSFVLLVTIIVSQNKCQFGNWYYANCSMTVCVAMSIK